MGRFTQFAVVAAREAAADAALTRETLDPDRCGVIISSGIGGQSITEGEHTRGMERGWDRVSPFYIPTAISNMAAGQVAIDQGLRGMCSCPVTACAGGSNAVGDAFHYIRDGYAEVMLCGGTEASITPPGHRRLHRHEGSDHRGGSRPGVHPLRRGALRLRHGRGRGGAGAWRS